MYQQVRKRDVEVVVKATFPEYRGRTFRVSTSIPSNLNSYWDGGSKTEYVFYHLPTGKTHSVHSNHPYFEANHPRQLSELPPGVLLVSHSWFCGKDVGITIYANECDLTPMLTGSTDDDAPLNVEVRRNESKNGVEIRFSRRPHPTIVKLVRDAGFRWSQRQGIWYKREMSGTWETAQRIQSRAVGEELVKS